MSGELRYLKLNLFCRRVFIIILISIFLAFVYLYGKYRATRMLPWHACSVVSSPGNLLTPLLKREPYPHHFDDDNTSPYGRLWQISTTSSSIWRHASTSFDGRTGPWPLRGSLQENETAETYTARRSVP